LFEAQAARRPDHVAVRFENQRVTYSELNARAERVALRLKKLGVGPETRVGICIAPSVEMIAALLGVLKAGGAYVPMDPNYPVERLSFMLGDSGVSVVLTERRLDDQFAGFRGAVVYMDEASDDSSAANAIQPPPQAATAGNLAYVIYTSGSTGRPKGVMLEHRGVCNLAHAQIEAFGITEESRELQFASLSFDASVSEIFTALLAGATLCMASREALMPGTGLSDLMRDNQITTVTLPPTALAILPDGELPNLNTLVVAGEACSAELVRRWSRGRRFLNAYGPTEVTVCATIGECTGGDDKPSIGRPLTNAQVYVLDAHLQPVPIGVIGELYIGGAGVARGYHNLPDMTAERFIPDPFSGRRGSRLFRSGDLARYLSNGDLDFIGRADNQVKLRGYRIELGEVEHALAGHTSVREAAVTVRENGAGDVRLVAYVTRADDGLLTPGELRRYLKTKLPGYMLPSDYVVMEGFPLGPSGKVDKLALPGPEGLRNDDNHPFVVPQTAMEQTIASVWRDVLNIDRVGVEDHFFDVGGHSLLMIQAVGKLQKALERELSVIELFRYPTINSLAKYLTGSEPQKSPISSKDRVRARQESSKEQRERRTKHRASARQAVAQPDPER
jgi:amino acid adenylation domain-containing protein